MLTHISQGAQCMFSDASTSLLSFSFFQNQNKKQQQHQNKSNLSIENSGALNVFA